MTTNVPSPTFGPNGFISASESAILAGVQADINAAFGGGVNFGTSSGGVTNPTPQGQLANSFTAIIGNTQDEFCFFTNQVDPAYATGRMQDAIARIYFLERNPAIATLVQATCTGASGTVIPAGALARASDGNLYATSGGTIPGSGTISLPFTCVAFGPIACPEGTLTTIYRAIGGWDTINNPADGILGSDTESRSAFEARRAASVALNSIGSLPSVAGSVLSVPNLVDAYVTENATNSPSTIGGVTLAANSLYVAASGGLDLDVATAIWKKKAPGCSYNGNTSVTVTDQNSGYNAPFPSYTVTFERPNGLEVIFSVVLINSALVPSDAAAQIQTAIINAFGGGDGGPRARIGSTILATRFIAPIIALGSWAQIKSLTLGSLNVPAASFTASITGTVMTVTGAVTGTIAVGQSIVDAAGLVLPGTTIASLGSGTGGDGTYNINNSQTVASEAMAGILAANPEVIVQINQVPEISANNITVSTVSS